jgi:peptidoglycan/LPS O-acetylase OafA/YrhL
VSAPAPNVAPPPGHPRFPLLDGVRALAALSVVLLHVGDGTGFARTNWLGAFTARMDAGVALFFVLSGFLLYRPFAAARLEGRPAPSAARYLRRRLLRIVPAFWLALLVMGALGWIAVLDGDWWRYFGFVQNLSVATVLGGIRPAWSLCVEMSFYLVLPLWAIGAARLLRGRPRVPQIRLEAVALGAVALASLLVRALFFDADHGSLWLVTLPAFLDWFAVGMGLALGSVALAGREPGSALLRRPWLAWAAAAACFAVVSLVVPLPRGLVAAHTVWAHLAQHVLYIAVGALVALPGIFGVRPDAEPVSRAIARFLGHPVMAWLGLVSYGIFLWHQPLLDQLLLQRLPERAPFLPFVTVLVLTTAGAVAIAAASYYLVERPFLALKDPRRREAPAAAPARSIAG